MRMRETPKSTEMGEEEEDRLRSARGAAEQSKGGRLEVALESASGLGMKRSERAFYSCSLQSIALILASMYLAGPRRRAQGASKVAAGYS